LGDDVFSGCWYRRGEILFDELMGGIEAGTVFGVIEGAQFGGVYRSGLFGGEESVGRRSG